MRSALTPAAALIFLTSFSAPAFTQHIASIDLGVIRQKSHHLVGMNVSGFYHFGHHWQGGIEINRLFPANRNLKGEEIRFSGWDIELNFHYLVNLPKNIHLYSIGGISHASEKEQAPGLHADERHFWSLNTGLGLNCKLGHWLPHVEYIFTWGELDQQFILTGLGYELEWGHRKKKQH